MTDGTNESGRWGPYRQASPPPARHRPGARSARRMADVRHCIADRPRQGDLTMWTPVLARQPETRPHALADQERRRPHSRRAAGCPSKPWKTAACSSFIPPVNYPAGIGSCRRSSPPTSTATTVLDLAVANFGSQHRERAAGQRRRHVPAGPDLRHRRPTRAPSRSATSTPTASSTSRPPTPGDVSVLLGNGDGTFQAPDQHRHRFESRSPWPWATSTPTASSTSGSRRTSIIPGYWRLLRLATPATTTGHANVLLGNGDGSFADA